MSGKYSPTETFSGKRTTRGTATRLGLVAILFWSTTIAFSRSLSEQLGTITAAAAIHFAGGALGWLVFLRGEKAIRRVLQLPRSYLFGCGALFGIYGICLYLAIGLSVTRQQVIEVGIINYLWPGLTLLFSLPVLKQRAGILLLPGILISLIGVVLVMVPPEFSLFSSRSDSAPVFFWPYLLALMAAISWGLYSNLARKFAFGVDTQGAVPIFLLLTGVVLLALRAVIPEASHLTLRACTEIAYMGLVPTVLAYVFWDISVRCGDLNLVATLSYLTPLFSTLVSCLYLGIIPGINVAFGCVLVIAGAFLSRASIIERMT